MDKITMYGYGCYYINNSRNAPDEDIIKLPGFVGYDDVPPIRIFVFFTKEARDNAISLIELKRPFCCGKLTEPMLIENEFYNGGE